MEDNLQTCVYTNYSLEDFITAFQYISSNNESVDVSVGIDSVISILKSISYENKKLVTKNKYNRINRVVISNSKIPDEDIKELRDIGLTVVVEEKDTECDGDIYGE